MATSSAEKALNAANAYMDKVLANPNATTKQITTAMTKLNKATDVYAQSILSSLSSGSSSGNYQQQPVQESVTQSVSYSGGAYLTATPPAPTVTEVVAAVQVQPVKTAPIDTVLFDDTGVSIDIMSDLIFENIGGQELLSIARSDTVNGQKISYQPIKNISAIQQQYNSNNIIGLQQTSNRYFAGFSIQLENKIPEVGNGTNGENIYIDDTTGDLIIEFVNLNSDEQIETQITVNGTIYEANLGA